MRLYGPVTYIWDNYGDIKYIVKCIENQHTLQWMRVILILEETQQQPQKWAALLAQARQIYSWDKAEIKGNYLSSSIDSIGNRVKSPIG